MRQPSYASMDSWRYALYRFGRWMNQFGLPGIWRFSRWVKHHIFTDHHFIRAPYLNGAIWCRPIDDAGRLILRHAVCEPTTTRLIQTFVGSDFAFIDVGANIGMHTISAGLAARQCESQPVLIAFEPDPFNYQVLQANVELNGFAHVQLVQAAVGAEAGTATLYLDESPASNSLIEAFTRAQNQIACPVVTLDDTLLTQPHSFESGAVVSLDIQGYEIQALAGGQNWLTQQENLALIVEVCPEFLYEQGSTPDDLVNRLRQFGCDPCYLTHENAGKLEPFDQFPDIPEGWINVVAAKGDSAKGVLQRCIE